MSAPAPHVRERLSRAALPRLTAGTRKPAPAVLSAGIGIVHLGLGAFHRAHQAVYTDSAMATAGGAWGICGVSLRGTSTAAALAPQDGLYTLVIRDTAKPIAHVVGSVQEALALRTHPDLVLARLTAPTTRIISLTVTEKGYGGDAETGALNRADRELAHDLSARPADRPRSTLGLLARALAQRRADGVGPVTVLSCDNIASNGDGLARLMRSYLLEIGHRDLAGWAEDHVSFPNTMVDRIVPAPTGTDRAQAAALTGLIDQATVATEPFSQWVIEDHFVAGRPAWDQVGVTVTQSVAGWERMKLRLLNAAHSLIAYLGGVMGFATVDRAIADPALRRAVTALWDEAETTLVGPVEVDLPAYRRALLDRFANPALPHKTAQIAQDGSQKLPIRILGTIADRRRQGAPVETLCLAVAAWMAWISRRDAAGAIIRPSDPSADTLVTTVERAGSDPDRLVDALLALRTIFPADLAADPVIRATTTASLRRLVTFNHITSHATFGGIYR